MNKASAKLFNEHWNEKCGSKEQQDSHIHLYEYYLLSFFNTEELFDVPL